MRDTGIVRRIDELGRVVIPKEIRKTLRIKEGDPLEIYTDKDELLLKKYSPIASMNGYAETVVKSLTELTGKVSMVTDTDEILFVSGNKYKECIGQRITQDVDKILKERKSVMFNKLDGGRTVKIFHGDEMGADNQIIVPIIVNGDCYGAVILFEKTATEKFSTSDLNLVRLGALVIAGQLE
jgi:AbrB family transcriptional regulator (stage V sporulation protein T)